MIAHISDEQLALHARGDLAAREQSAVEDHLDACSDCQARASEFAEIQALLRNSINDPRSADLAEVRHRVLNGIRPRSPGLLRWLVMGAAAAALAGMLIVRAPGPVPMAVHAPAKVQTTVSITRSIPPPPIERPLLHERRKPRPPGMCSVDLIAHRDQPTFIRMTTSDPNIVILWQPTERTEQP